VKGFLLDPYAAPFMARALIEVLLLGVLGAVVGVHVLLRRLAFLTEALQHSVFPGIAIAFVVGQSLLLGALVAALLTVVLLVVLARRPGADHDSVLALLIAGFFALGVVVVSRRTGYQADLTALLFGRILDVDARQLLDTAIVTVVCLLVLAALHKELVLRAFDPAASEALGYARALDLALLLAVAATVVTAVPLVGVMLSVALLSVPAMSARLVTRRVGTMMLVGAGYGAVSGVIGLTVSAEWDISAGAAIALTTAALFALTWIVTTVQACWLHPVTTTPTPTP